MFSGEQRRRSLYFPASSRSCLRRPLESLSQQDADTPLAEFAWLLMEVSEDRRILQTIILRVGVEVATLKEAGLSAGRAVICDDGLRCKSGSIESLPAIWTRSI